MRYNRLKAELTTKTYNRDLIEKPVGNIYRAISIIAKRAVQVNSDIKSELSEKLKDFESYSDSLEEVFENKEQIEVSKYYEALPKPHSIAISEWESDSIYYRENDQIEE
ncbi:MAG: DNA-directed RNA polymerase subunit omega [Flavobacteriaceae bacterium]|nr:DNA-directed RNA polymerase subunit omega [Flavobacteriaceae bacterium]MCY4267883.1 DNA-directed RNA polymerase subunit omega [Flavobacteriaceae bacterium]MCY4298790.1 DNA-directed RNA polymerase subunit omega [Flavobacteriaceae bacterium]